MTKHKWPLVVPNDDGIRTAGKPDQCLYCKSVIGQEHARDCVVVKKRVRIKVTITYEVDEPYSWTAEQIESHRNNGSWCGNNALQEIENYTEQFGCLCEHAHFEVIEVTDDTPRRDVAEPVEVR
jgi:hypothetical protein